MKLHNKAYYIANYKEEDIIKNKFKELGIKLETNFSTNTPYLMVSTTCECVKFYSSGYNSFEKQVSSFEQWCKECIEGYEETTTKPIPKFNIGDKVQVCNEGKCNGSGWKNADNTYSPIMGVSDSKVKINAFIYDDKKKEYYYQVGISGGTVAEHALTLLETTIKEEASIQKLEPNQVSEWDKTKTLYIKGDKSEIVEAQKFLISLGYRWIVSGEKIQPDYKQIEIRSDKSLANQESLGSKWMYAEDFIRKYGKTEPKVEKSTTKKIVYCIFPMHGLTLGKGYEILSEYSGTYLVVDDGENKVHFGIDRFSDTPPAIKQYPIKEETEEFKIGDIVELVYYIYDCFSSEDSAPKGLFGEKGKIVNITSAGNLLRIEGSGRYYDKRHFRKVCSVAPAESPLYKKEGNKHTFEYGYKGEHPFKVGQRVIVHEGSNIDEKEIKGVITALDFVTSSLYPSIRVQTGEGIADYSSCYPVGSRKLDVTILSEVEETHRWETIKDKGICFIDDSPTSIKEDWKYEVTVKSQKPKPNMSLIPENIEVIPIKVTKKTKPNFSLI